MAIKGSLLLSNPTVISRKKLNPLIGQILTVLGIHIPVRFLIS